MKETVFQSKVIKRLFYQGCWTFNIHGHREQMAGVPDLHVVHKNWSGYIELKVGKGKLKPSQENVMPEIRKRGYPALVLRDDNTIRDIEGDVIGTWDGSVNSLIMASEVQRENHYRGI